MYYIFNETRRGSVYGVGTYIRELTSALKECGIRVCVIYLRSEKETICITEEEGIRHWYFPAPQSVNTTMPYDKQQDRYLRNIVYLLKLHIKSTEKIVFHLNFNQCNVLAIELKKSFNCYILAIVHYLDWANFLLGNLGRLRSILAKEQLDDNQEELVRNSVENDRLFYAAVDHMVCLSQYTRRVLCEEYFLDPTKISVVLNGMKDYAPKIIDRKSLRCKWWFSTQEKIILFVGRLDDVKGLKYLIEAFRKTLRVYPQCRLVMAGDGAYNAYMKVAEDISAKITYTGFLDKTKLYELYSIADIGVMPSFHEQCSYVAIEMMMHGIPLIASTSTGLKEMIEDGITGLHIPVVEYPDRVEIDTSLLAEKMLYLLQNPEEVEQLGKNARKRYEKYYTSITMRENMLTLYQGLFVDND